MENTDRRHSRPRAWPPSRRFWVGLGVTVAWVAVMSLLWWREGRRSGVGLRQMGLSPEILLVEFGGYSHWMWIDQADKRIGLHLLSIMPRDASEIPAKRSEDQSEADSTETDKPFATPGYELDTRTRLEVQMLGLKLPVDLAAEVSMNHSFEMETMQARITLGRQLAFFDAFVEGQRLYYRIRTPAEILDADQATTPTVIQSPQGPAGGSEGSLLAPGRDWCGRSRLEGPVVLSEVVLPILARPKTLKEGQQWTTQVSNPLLGRLNTEIEVRVEGRETIELDAEPVDAWKLTERLGTMTSDSWYDDQGRLMRRKLPGRIVWSRTTTSEVMHDYPNFSSFGEFEPIDRNYIKSHLDPDLVDVKIEELLPISHNLF